MKGEGDPDDGDSDDGDPGNGDPGGGDLGGGDPGGGRADDGDPGGGGVDDDEGRLQQYFSPAGGPALKAQPDQHCKLHTGLENTQVDNPNYEVGDH